MMYVKALFLPVHLFVTRQYCIETAVHIIAELMPHSSPGTYFLMAEITIKMQWGHPPMGDVNAHEVGK